MSALLTGSDEFEGGVLSRPSCALPTRQLGALDYLRYLRRVGCRSACARRPHWSNEARGALSKSVVPGPGRNQVPTVTSVVYNLLLRTQRLEEKRLTKGLWKAAWKASLRQFHGPVSTVIHGQPVTVNFGYTYPYLARKFPLYNQPLLELVYQACVAKGSPINLVDVGAAVGDTVLLVEANCPAMVDTFHCVDGDPEFFGYLRRNLGQKANRILHFALVSSSSGEERALVRTHRGTASAQGDQYVKACTLDSLLASSDRKRVDVIKIDVDGLDGRVLAGATTTLNSQAPSVIFEWHPILCEQTGNSWLQHFDVLHEAGYTRFVWFTKFGGFSHFSTTCDEETLNAVAALCLRSKHCDDWHYDVVAVHAQSKLDVVALAELQFAKRRISRC